LKDHRGSKIVLLVFFTLPQSQERLKQLDDAQAQLTAAEVEIILVPSDGEKANIKIGTVSEVVSEGSREIFETYSLFGNSFAYDSSSSDASRPLFLYWLSHRRCTTSLTVPPHRVSDRQARLHPRPLDSP